MLTFRKLSDFNATALLWQFCHLGVNALDQLDPDICGLRSEDETSLGRDDVPVTSGDLIVQLSRSPSGISRVGPKLLFSFGDDTL